MERRTRRIWGWEPWWRRKLQPWWSWTEREKSYTPTGGRLCSDVTTGRQKKEHRLHKASVILQTGPTRQRKKRLVFIVFVHSLTLKFKCSWDVLGHFRLYLRVKLKLAGAGRCRCAMQTLVGNIYEVNKTGLGPGHPPPHGAWNSFSATAVIQTPNLI